MIYKNVRQGIMPEKVRNTRKIVEWHMPFSSSEKLGWEIDLMLLCACIALMTLGSGFFGADAMLWH